VALTGEHDIARLTTDELRDLFAGNARVAILLPVGAIEPHGPHLPLDTDLIISRAAAEAAVPLLASAGVVARIAPDVSYGVTECAAGFAGAVGVAPEELRAYLAGVVGAWVANGAHHVCIVNNHLEPAHDSAVRAAVATFAGRAMVASPLTRRWARTLDDEFKRGACHAGEYETSIVMAATPGRVRENLRQTLPDVDVSLSEKLRAGVATFRAMGLDRAYAGFPARASSAHGADMIARLAEMVAGEILDASST